MRASITADSGRGPGYGIIEVFDAGETAADPKFVLQRASDGKCLSMGGWQESETTLTPDAWDSDGGSLRMAVGPSVVDEVDNLDAYRVSLRGGVCVLTVQKLIYSHISGGQGIGGYAAPVTPQRQLEPVPAPEPEEPQEEPAQEQSVPLTMPVERQEQPAKSRLGLLLALALTAIAAGVAVWWFLLRTPDTPPLPPHSEQGQGSTEKPRDLTEKPQGPAEKNQESAEQPQGSAEKPQGPAEQPQVPATPKTQSALSAAREQLRGAAQPDVSLAMAKPLRKADAAQEESDAAFLLLEDAAQKGNAEAMLLVGQYYDPTSTMPRGSIPTDLSQAKRWYDAALQKGQAEARTALNTLKEYAREQAAKGNAEAGALLQHWQ